MQQVFMTISQLKSKIKSFYTIFIAPPKEWQLPKKSDVLIYDNCGAELIAPYLTKYNVTTMAVRGESINVPCLLRAAITLNFWKVWKYNPITLYTDAFIHAVSPKVVITFIDNNTNFYRISKRFPILKTIFLQNGTRFADGDVFDGLIKKDNYYVDYMLVAGKAIGRHYLRYLSGQTVPIGSLKNNAVSNLNGIVGDGVLFISQWEIVPEDGAALYIEHDGTPVYLDQLFAAEIKILKFLDKWCAENNKQFKISGRETHKNGPEKEYYAHSLKEGEYEYIPRTGSHSSYKLIDAAEIVVSIDSTLGYESIGRGKKTAFFSCRKVNPKKNYYTFGWPAVLPNNGPFWTNHQDETQFQRIMDYLNTVSDENWKQTRQQYANDLMEFDPGNTRFIALLDQLLPKTDNQCNTTKSHAN